MCHFFCTIYIFNNQLVITIAIPVLVNNSINSNCISKMLISISGIFVFNDNCSIVFCREVFFTLA